MNTDIIIRIIAKNYKTYFKCDYYIILKYFNFIDNKRFKNVNKLCLTPIIYSLLTKYTYSLSYEDKYDLFFKACKFGKEDIIKYLLKFIKISNNHILKAIYNEHHTVVDILLNHGNIDVYDSFVVRYICYKSNNVVLIEKLLKNKNIYCYNDVFIWASVKGYLDIVKYILEDNDIKLHQSAVFLALCETCKEGHLEIIKILQKYYDITIELTVGIGQLRVKYYNTQYYDVIWVYVKRNKDYLKIKEYFS